MHQQGACVSSTKQLCRIQLSYYSKVSIEYCEHDITHNLHLTCLPSNCAQVGKGNRDKKGKASTQNATPGRRLWIQGSHAAHL